MFNKKSLLYLVSVIFIINAALLIWESRGSKSVEAETCVQVPCKICIQCGLMGGNGSWIEGTAQCSPINSNWSAYSDAVGSQRHGEWLGTRCRIKTSCP